MLRVRAPVTALRLVHSGWTPDVVAGLVVRSRAHFERNSRCISNPRTPPSPRSSGIQGFDEITDGGLPRGRTALVMGGPGCGKTVFALQALINAAHRDKEAGIFVAFEESTRQIVANAATFGWDLPGLEKRKLFFL